MRKVLETIDRISTFLAILVFVPWMLVLIINIIMRQFSSGISWYSEGSQYLNIWAVLIATVGNCAINDQLRIDVVEGMLKGTPKRILRLLVAALTITFLVVLGYSFVLLASRSRQVVSSMTMMKMAWVYWPLPILCFLSAISCLLHTIWDFMNSSGKKNNQALTSEGTT